MTKLCIDKGRRHKLQSREYSTVSSVHARLNHATSGVQYTWGMCSRELQFIMAHAVHTTCNGMQLPQSSIQ